MKNLGNSMHWVLAFGLSAAVGCGAAPDGAQDEETLGTTTQALTIMGYHGGTGGEPFTGPLASFGYDGFHIRSGDYVDQLIPVYYSPYGEGPAIGLNGGKDDGWQRCPNWLVGVYVHIHASQFVSDIGLICGDVDHTNNLVLGPFGARDPEDVYFLDLCPVGEVVRQVRGRAGAWLDGLQIVCGAPNT